MLYGLPVSFQLDCGATCNLLSLALVGEKIHTALCKQVLIMCNKTIKTPVGKCRLKIIT